MPKTTLYLTHLLVSVETQLPAAKSRRGLNLEEEPASDLIEGGRKLENLFNSICFHFIWAAQFDLLSSTDQLSRAGSNSIWSHTKTMHLRLWSNFRGILLIWISWFWSSLCAFILHANLLLLLLLCLCGNLEEAGMLLISAHNKQDDDQNPLLQCSFGSRLEIIIIGHWNRWMHLNK